MEMLLLLHLFLVALAPAPGQF